VALRDHIKAKHDEAEKHPFVVSLLSGNLPVEAYSEYLLNQTLCYHALEALADKHGLLDDIQGIHRTALIAQDVAELGCEGKLHNSTREYILYLDTLPPPLLWAHIYARHFADMYGGQMIKKVAPGSGRMYEFENRTELIAKVREKLSDDLADEANRVLDFALRLFDEVAESYHLNAEGARV
jgi:heme oxygenase